MFRGVYTALITPFTPSGALDLEALEGLIERQIEAGVDGLVPCGTTGEAATLTDGERVQVFRATVAAARGRCNVHYRAARSVFNYGPARPQHHAAGRSGHSGRLDAALSAPVAVQ